jgi:hypothetical protein
LIVSRLSRSRIDVVANSTRFERVSSRGVPMHLSYASISAAYAMLNHLQPRCATAWSELSSSITTLPKRMSSIGSAKFLEWRRDRVGGERFLATVVKCPHCAPSRSGHTLGNGSIKSLICKGEWWTHKESNLGPLPCESSAQV